jgi:dolichol-phosphate mannosyltransferase
VSPPKIEPSWEVPSYEAEILRERRSKYCICVFVINEGERLHRQLSRMRSFSGEIDIVIADGGSTDGSTDLNILREQGVTALLTKTSPGKLSSQMRMAFAWALSQGYDGVVSVDGNDKDGIEETPSFLRSLDEGYDHVQGSRFMVGGEHRNTPTLRLLAVRALHVPLISLAARVRYTDTTNGYRAYSARLLTDSRMAVFRDVFSDYELHYYLAVRAPRLGLRCNEIPVSRCYPPVGNTPTKIRSIAAHLRVFAQLVAVCVGAYNPNSWVPDAALRRISG